MSKILIFFANFQSKSWGLTMILSWNSVYNATLWLSISDFLILILGKLCDLPLTWLDWNWRCWWCCTECFLEAATVEVWSTCCFLYHDDIMVIIGHRQFHDYSTSLFFSCFALRFTPILISYAYVSFNHEKMVEK